MSTFAYSDGICCNGTAPTMVMSAAELFQLAEDEQIERFQRIRMQQRFADETKLRLGFGLEDICGMAAATRRVIPFLNSSRPKKPMVFLFLTMGMLSNSWARARADWAPRGRAFLIQAPFTNAPFRHGRGGRK